VPLPHPRRRLRDQHAVVHGYSTPCFCTQYGAYAVRVGVEPSNAALALPDRHFPAGGLCSPLVCADYLLVLFQQRRQPVRLLNACVKLPILPRKVIALRCVAATLTVLMNFTSERVVRPCAVEAALASSR